MNQLKIFQASGLNPTTVDFEERWHDIHSVVSKVLAFERIPRDIWSLRFTDVYKLCIAHPEPLADRLYDATKMLLEQHVIGMCKEVRSYKL